MEQCPQQLINMKIFLHIFLMVGASRANMLTDQLDKKIITVSLLNAM